MRFFRLILATLSLLFAGACATGEWQASNVPLPTATPYDLNQMVRTAYLEGFRHGYRAQKGWRACQCGVGDRTLRARPRAGLLRRRRAGAGRRLRGNKIGRDGSIKDSISVAGERIGPKWRRGNLVIVDRAPYF